MSKDATTNFTITMTKDEREWLARLRRRVEAQHGPMTTAAVMRAALCAFAQWNGMTDPYPTKPEIA